jgi:hypothetical protein
MSAGPSSLHRKFKVRLVRKRDLAPIFILEFQSESIERPVEFRRKLVHEIVECHVRGQRHASHIVLVVDLHKQIIPLSILPKNNHNTHTFTRIFIRS